MPGVRARLRVSYIAVVDEAECVRVRVANAKWRSGEGVDPHTQCITKATARTGDTLPAAVPLSRCALVCLLARMHALWMPGAARSTSHA